MVLLGGIKRTVVTQEPVVAIDNALFWSAALVATLLLII